MLALLREAGIPIEPEVNDPLNTFVFEYPIEQTGRVAEEVTIWEQAMNIVTLQREWSDNAVSNTIYFKPKWTLVAHEWEKDSIEDLIESYGFDTLCSGIVSDCEVKMVRTATDVKFYHYNQDHEEDMIEPVLSSIMPHVKMVSFLPHSGKGVYKQMPEEGITREEYLERLSEIDRIDWQNYHGSDGEDEKFCTGDICTMPAMPGI